MLLAEVRRKVILRGQQMQMLGHDFSNGLEMDRQWSQDDYARWNYSGTTRETCIAADLTPCAPTGYTVPNTPRFKTHKGEKS